ncbi:MAG: helix-turn-helix transcriptional regulator [Reinekea sp.]|nr:helix-turn-helix transcriptional regulator [Reinekea sp.]
MNALSLPLIEGIATNTVFNKEAWHLVTEQLVESFNLQISHMMILNKQSMGLRFHVDAGQRINDELANSYMNHYINSDHLLHRVLSAPADRFYTIATLPDAEVAYASEHFQEWAKPQGLIDSAAACLVSDNDWLGLLICNRSETEGPFTALEIEQLNQLLPRLQQGALHSFSREQSANDHARIEALVETFRIPVAILSETGTINSMNTSMRTLIESVPDLDIQNGHMTLKNKNVEKLLYLSLVKTAKRIEGYNFTREEEENLQVSDHLFFGFQPLMNNHISDKPVFTGVMIYAVSPNLIKPIQAEKLSAIFGLTQKEAAVAQQLAQGQALKTIADAEHISLNTVKFHLKNIFEKTGCSSQLALNNLINSIPFST